MKMVELEVFSEASNHAVIRPRGRRFPGAVVQGDSLWSLCDEAKEISERLRSLEISDEELLHLAQMHQENLLSRLLHYQQVLAEHGMSLPYSTPAQASDLVTLIEESPGDQP
jgi:hypothetical protein